MFGIKKEKKQVIHKQTINIDTRINNCFAAVEMKYKKEIMASWNGFMDYLVAFDKSMISLLADVEVLAASNEYVLISSKNDATNSLINDSIFKLEKLYTDYSGNKYRFAALNQELWKKEAANYSKNLKNKVQYKYVEENIEEVNESNESTTDNSNSSIEDLATDIFGSFEVE